MNPDNSISLNSRAWKDLYKAAVFEVDETRLQDRIAQAEEALALRARELFYAAGDSFEEEQALDDAAYALHALRNRPQTYRSMEAAQVKSQLRCTPSLSAAFPGCTSQPEWSDLCTSSRNDLSLPEREGWRSLHRALASIWRMRARVTANTGLQSRIRNLMRT